MRFGISVRGESDVCMEQRGLPASRVALESIGPEEPASVSDSRVATRTGPLPHLNASKIVPVYKLSAGNLQVECKIISAIMSTGCVQRSTGSLQCLQVECSAQLIDNK
jgi:hypothetical protein